MEDVESHLVISASGVLNIKHELDVGRHDVYALADHVHSIRDVGATLASGAFQTAGMVIVPCSMRTLAAVAHGLSDNHHARRRRHAQERRRLVMMVRETPFNLAHLRNMTAVTEMGGIVFPPCRRSITGRPASRKWWTTPWPACWKCSISTCPARIGRACRVIPPVPAR